MHVHERWVLKLTSVAVVQGKMHFSEVMTGMLSEDDTPGSVKMVGPTINCEGTVVLPSGLERSNPYIPSSALATDQTGALMLHIAMCCS